MARLCSSPPAPRAKKSIPSATSPTVPAAAWDMPWPRPRYAAARAFSLSAGRPRSLRPEPPKSLASSPPKKCAMPCSSCLPQASIVIKTAAVSDYRPKAAAGQKIKRKGPMTLELEATPDILKEISLKKRRKSSSASPPKQKMFSKTPVRNWSPKNLDAIVVNDVSREGVGFDSDRNAVTIITHEEVVEVPETTKWEVAQRVLDQVVRLRQHRKSP